MPLKEAIPAICRAKGISAPQLAHRIAMSDVGVRLWANGRSASVKKLQTRHLLRQIAREAGIEIEELEE